MLIWLVACQPSSPTPLIEGRGGGAGYWPPNSPTAIHGAINSGFDGLEVDVVLTRDRIPVLWGEPSIRAEVCTLASGAEMGDPVLVRSLTVAELQEQYRCGGKIDPAFPNALVVAEPVMTLDELIDALRDGAQFTQRVHLHLGQADGTTLGPTAFAVQVLDRWETADLPQPLRISANHGDMIEAFEVHSRTRGLDVPTTLQSDPTGSGVEQELQGLLGTVDPLAPALDIDADGIGLPWIHVDRALAEHASDLGLALQLRTVNDPDAIRQLSRWPIDSILTDYPGDTP